MYVMEKCAIYLETTCIDISGNLGSRLQIKDAPCLVQFSCQPGSDYKLRSIIKTEQRMFSLSDGYSQSISPKVESGEGRSAEYW